MKSPRTSALVAAGLALTFIGGVALAPAFIAPAAAQLVGDSASRSVETTFGAHLGGKNVLTTAVEYIGVTEEDLRAELQAGKSLAEVAVENGKTREGLVAALTDAAAEEIETLVDRKGPFPGPGLRDKIRMHIVGDVLGTAAEYLGLSAADLREALEDSTLAEVAEDTDGKSRDGLIDALVGSAEEAIDQAQTNGRITEEQAAQMKANLEEQMTRLVDSDFPLRGPFGGPGPFRWRGP